MEGLAVTIRNHFKRVLPLPLQKKGKGVVVALESSGECLKLAQVTVGAGGKRITKLVARTVVLQEDLSKTLCDLVDEGLIPTDTVLISIPRNLVTVRTLQLPTTDPQELKEMANLQAVKQTPFLKDEVISAYQVIRSSPEGYTDVMLVTTHRSVSNSSLRFLDDANLQAGGIRLSSQGILNAYHMVRGSSGKGEDDPVAIVDIDSSFSDFMVVLDGQICFTKTLSIGPTKLQTGGEGEFEKFTEEIQRAVDIYGNEEANRKIANLVITGAEVDLVDFVPRLKEKLHLPVERISLLDSIEPTPEVLDLPEAKRQSVSFASVLGLAWNPSGAQIDLTPHEVRLREALAQKGKAITTIGILSILILTAVTIFISQTIYSKKMYLEQLHQEVRQTQKEASKVETMKKKLRIIRDAIGFENSSLEVLAVLHRSIPSDIYLKGIAFEDGSHLILKGVAEKMSGVFGFLATLEKQPNFHHVKTKHITRSVKKGGSEQIDFEMTCLLTKNGEV